MVTIVYVGLVNKNIVPGLQAIGVNAIGLTGADANIIRAHKRPVKDGVDYGFVGDVDAADGQMIARLVESGATPVVAPLTHDGQGHILNTNADTIAKTVACAVARDYEVTLVYAFEKRGVLSNPADDNIVIPTITLADFDRYVADGVIAGGMIPKVENALAAIDEGVARVVITQADAIDGQQGTIIR